MSASVRRHLLTVNGDAMVLPDRRAALEKLVGLWNRKYASEMDGDRLTVAGFDRAPVIVYERDSSQSIDVDELKGWLRWLFDEVTLVEVDIPLAPGEGEGNPPTLWASVEAACYEPDLDAALRPVQEAIGVQWGDEAAVFFSGPDRGDAWPALEPMDRFFMLRDYVRTELWEVSWRIECRADPSLLESAGGGE